MADWLRSPIAGVLLDISGVLINGSVQIAGSPEAYLKLSKALPIRLVTNETQLSRELIRQRLEKLGYDVDVRHIFSPAPAMASILKKGGLRPYLFVNPPVVADFEGVDQSNPNCFVIGDAPSLFSFEPLNDAFRFLANSKDAQFFSLGMGKYYKEGDELVLDVGAFSHALEYATDRKAELVGKPSKSFFQAALDDMQLDANQVVMIGDDIVGDVGGAQNAGMRGILVRTGKYRPSDEDHKSVKPDAIVDDLDQAVELILDSKRT